MLLLYLYINIPVSFLYISKKFNALNLLYKPFVGTRYGLLEIVLRARFCNLCTLGMGAKFGHSFGLTTCGRPQLKLLLLLLLFYDLGLRPISGAGRRKLQPNLAPTPYLNMFCCHYPIEASHNLSMAILMYNTIYIYSACSGKNRVTLFRTPIFLAHCLHTLLICFFH